MSTPSWKWLPSRSTARELAAGAASSPAPSRPCLPSVEALGDRIMLSAAPALAASDDGQVPVDRILIGLLKGELSRVNSELAALKLVGGEDPKLLHQLTQGLLKVDAVVSKVGEAVIKGELTENKENKALELLESEFLKIDAALQGLSPAVQKQVQAAIGDIKLGAGELVEALSGIKLDELSHKDEQTFIKITDAFGDVGAGLLKLEQDILASKVRTDKQNYLVIKLTDVLVSSFNKVTDEGLKEQLTGIVADTEKILIGLLQPVQTPGDVIG